MQVIAAEGAPGDLSGLSFSPQVDLGHIYGDNLERQYQLRLFKDGKLKYQVALGLWTGGGGGLLWSSLAGAVGGPEWWPRGASCRSWRCEPWEKVPDRRRHDLSCYPGRWIWALVGEGHLRSADMH